MRDVSAINQVNFSGAPVTTDIKLCAPPEGTPKAVKFLIDWSQYGAVIGQSRAVLLNVQVAGAGQQINAIRSIHIDNRNCGTTIVARFPDTGFQVEVLPNEEKFVPVVTAQLQVEIYALGFVTAAELTQVFLSNILPPVMIGGASPSVTTGTINVTATATAKSSEDNDRNILHSDRILRRSLPVPNAAPINFVFSAPVGSTSFFVQQILVKTVAMRSGSMSSHAIARAQLWNATAGAEAIGVDCQANLPGGSFGHDNYTDSNTRIELSLSNMRWALTLSSTYQLRFPLVFGSASGSVEMYLVGTYGPA